MQAKGLFKGSVRKTVTDRVRGAIAVNFTIPGMPLEAVDDNHTNPVNPARAKSWIKGEPVTNIMQYR